MATTYPIGTGSGGLGSAIGRVRVETQVNGEAAGVLIDVALSNANSPCYPQSSNLSSGFNAISIPAKAGGVVLVPPSGNTQTITLKGITGDTGFALSKTAPFVLTFDTTPPASFGLTTGGTINDFRFYWF